MNKIICLFVTALLPSLALAQASSWRPQLEFTLEGGTPEQALTWVSGWSYALTEVGRASAGKPGAHICLPPQGNVESQVMVGILNAKFKGQNITSEQAASALWSGALSRYGCGKGPNQSFKADK